MPKRLSFLGPAGREIRMAFRITLPEYLHEPFKKFIQQEEITTEGRAAATLIEIALSALPPADVLKKSARSHAYNDTRYWTMVQVGHALKDIKALLDSEIASATHPDVPEKPE